MKGVSLRRFASGLVFACASCSGQASEDWDQSRTAIMGGEQAAPAQFESVVWLDGGCTGTLVHERLILTAGHCSQGNQAAWFGSGVHVEIDGDRVVTTPLAGDVSVPVERCEAHAPVDGNRVDLAFCVLAQPMAGVPVVPLAAPCERARVTAGDPMTLVGYGFESFGGSSPGVKRIATAALGTGDALFVGTDSAGSCWGDSGGPVFARIGARAWRQLGVLSQGEAGKCGFGVYVEPWPYVSWLEDASGVDLTTCDAASPSCIERLDGDGFEQPPIEERTCTDSVPNDGGCGVSSAAGAGTIDAGVVVAAAALVSTRRRRRGTSHSTLAPRAATKGASL